MLVSEFTVYLFYSRMLRIQLFRTFLFFILVNGSNRVVRLWLGSGGRHIKISMNGRSSSSVLVDITKKTWRHICLSYQSDFGAWAIYVDGRLTSCEAAQSVRIYLFILYLCPFLISEETAVYWKIISILKIKLYEPTETLKQ